MESMRLNLIFPYIHEICTIITNPANLIKNRPLIRIPKKFSTPSVILFRNTDNFPYLFLLNTNLQTQKLAPSEKRHRKINQCLHLGHFCYKNRTDASLQLSMP